MLYSLQCYFLALTAHQHDPAKLICQPKHPQPSRWLWDQSLRTPGLCALPSQGKNSSTSKVGRQLEGRDSKSFETLSLPLQSHLQHWPASFLMTTHTGVWTKPTVFAAVVHPWSLILPALPRDYLAGIAVGWADALISVQRLVYSQLFFYPAGKKKERKKKNTCRSCQPKEISVFSAVKSNWFFLYWQLFKLNLGSQGN